jgi:hypothetical protein
MERNNFESLSQNKNELLRLLAFDDDIAKCLKNGLSNFKNNTITVAEKAKLIYTHIFPYMKTSNTITDVGSYITMRFRYKRSSRNNIFKTASIQFVVFCNESIVNTDYQVLRTDYLISCIDKLLSDTRIQSGIGKLEFDSMDDIVIDNEGKYIGISILYKNIEFQ